MRKNLVIATRGSQLALWQAEHVKACLESLEPGLNISLRVIKTRGDIILDVPLSKVGGKGLFVKEIEEALLDGSADLAVHSIKDVPMVLPEGLVLGCVPQREICVDCLLSNRYASLDELPRGPAWAPAACAARPSCSICVPTWRSFPCAAMWIPACAR